MVSISDARVLVTAICIGCTSGEDAAEPTSKDLDDDSGAPADTSDVDTSDVDTDTAHTGTVAATGDTALPIPTVCGEPLERPIRLVGDEAGDFTGRWLDAADLDGDGCDELVVSESWDFGQYGLGGIRSAAHLVQHPLLSGDLHDVAFATFEGSGASNGLDYWGAPSALLPATRQLVVGGQRDNQTLDYPVHLLDVPGVPPTGPIPSTDLVASLHAPPPFGQFGIPATLSRCEFGGTASLCLGAIQSGTEVAGDFAGQVLVYPLPVPAEFHVVDDATARYLGDPGDRADQVDGQYDLDGDGVLDLLIGAYWGRSQHDGVDAGAVAVLSAPPDGVHRVWDVADAVLTGLVPNSNFGLSRAAGDLDGDGHLDLLVGAHFGPSGAAWVFRGPFAGTRSAADAEWQVEGQPGDWLGFAGVVGDLDGDGADDLAVGAPRSVYVGTEPGQVLIWPSPPAGALDAATAPIALVSGVGIPDAFGVALEGGDFDGDGRMDLAIGAPRDPTVGAYGGSVTLVFGASL